MKNIKSHFVFNAQERNGIFLLVLLIILLQVLYYSWNYFGSETVEFFENEKEAMAVQQQIDSLKRVATDANKPKITPFNPNYLTDFRAYSLGMSPEEAERLFEHRKQDKWVNSPEEFQNVTKVSDSLLNTVLPFLKFPDFQKKESQAFSISKNKNIPVSGKFDINKATAEDFTQINGVGEVLSQRIIAYRSKLGGFVDAIQLKDVYGLKPEVVQRISVVFEVKNSDVIEKTDINKATVLQLSEIPYFDYQLAREIVDYRNLHEKINSFEDLTNIRNFPADKIDRIKLYLSIN